MNELFLYQLLKNIFKASMVIDGRFVVAEHRGIDLNKTNWGQVVLDALGSIGSVNRKYPAVVLLPPTDQPKFVTNWSLYRLRLYFITLQERTGDGQVKTPSPLDGTVSLHTIQEDWADMHTCALDFRKMFNNVCKRPEVINYVREIQPNNDLISRFTDLGTDKVSGVCLDFSVQVAVDCNQYDYAAAATDIEVPPLNSHPLHKQ